MLLNRYQREEMAKYRISAGLSVRSFENMIKQVEAYQNGLNRKCELLCQRLAEVGRQAAVTAINDSPLGKTITLSVQLEPKAVVCKAILMAVGQTKESEGYGSINTLLLVEFGSGIRYNASANPKAGEFGMGVGTFPGQTHAFDPDGWYYWGADNQWHHSFGVKATMPIYKASLDIRQQIQAIAREVFG